MKLNTISTQKLLVQNFEKIRAPLLGTEIANFGPEKESFSLEKRSKTSHYIFFEMI